MAPDTIVTFGPDGMSGHEDHQTVSRWATAARAAAAPDARLLYATTTEEFVDRWEPGARGVQRVPRRRAAAAHPGRRRWPWSCASTRRCVDRKLVALRAQASQTDGLFAALGEERVRRVVVDRDVRRRRHRPRPCGGLGNLAAGGMSTDPPRRTGAALSVLGRGARDSVAVALAYLPFGLALGATLGSSHLPALVAWSTSPLLFGGAAQLLAVQLLAAGASGVVVVLAALIVNARMLLYGAALAPHAAAWPARWRWLGAYLLADPVYALAVARFSRPDGGGSARHRLLYYLGVGVALWTAWHGA